MRLITSVLLGIALVALTGCGKEQSADPPVPVSTAAPSVAASLSPTPTPSPTPAYKYDMLAKISGGGITVYYQTEEEAAKDVLAVARENTDALAHKLELEDHAPIDIYVFDTIEQFHQASYPNAPNQPDWLIGSYKKPDILLTSPANPGPAHNRESILLAATHEIVHLLSFEIKPNTNRWISEGIAVFMAGQVPSPEFAQANLPPPTANDLLLGQHFDEQNGYQYSYYLYEYLDVTYGWEAVLTCYKTANYQKAFGEGLEIVHENWLLYLKEQYNITATPE